MRATVWDVWSPREHPLRGDRLEVVVGVVHELECLGDVADQHGSTGTQRANEGTE